MRFVATILLLCVLAIAGSMQGAVASVVLEFRWAESTWDATHVVVAAQDATNRRRFRVLESWVGSPLVGTELDLDPGPGYPRMPARKPGVDFPVTGKRVVLFLLRDDAKQAWVAPADWRCWIEEGQGYAWSRRLGGGTRLVSLGMKEEELRTRVLGLRADKEALNALRADADLAQRVEGAKRLLAADVDLVVEDAFKVLGTCGKGAVPLLASHLDGDHFHEALRALAAIGDTSAVPPLLVRLEREIAYWVDAKPRLAGGSWQDATEKERDTYETRLLATHSLLDTLKRVPSRTYEEPVRRLLRLWNEPPEIREIPYGHIARACAAALQALEPAPAAAR